MQRALCLKMAVGCTCINKFARLFSKFDTDNSGVLEKSEVVVALQSLGIDKNMAKKTAGALDVNGDDSCEYLEFAAACLSSLEEQFDELLRQEFRALDHRRKGFLTDKEMAPLLAELKPLAAAHGLVLEDMDSNSDGVISFTEFCEYFGRPGIDYTDTLASPESRAAPSLPMKQHVRIVGKAGEIEESMEEIRKTMEASVEINRSSDHARIEAIKEEPPIAAKSSSSSPSKRPKKADSSSQVGEEAASDATAKRTKSKDRAPVKRKVVPVASSSNSQPDIASGLTVTERIAQRLQRHQRQATPESNSAGARSEPIEHRCDGAETEEEDSSKLGEYPVLHNLNDLPSPPDQNHVEDVATISFGHLSANSFERNSTASCAACLTNATASFGCARTRDVLQYTAATNSQNRAGYPVRVSL